jgi:autocrine motility factor receptor
MAYCCLILLGKFIQKLVFGELRVSEQQHIKDTFWNFVFYKFIFVFGVINVQYMDEVVLWCSWFSVLGFLHLLAQLCKDRFEYVSVIVFTAFKIDCIVTCIQMN